MLLQSDNMCSTNISSKIQVADAMLKTDLAGIIEELVLKLLDAEDLLEHLIQLVLAEDEFGGSAGRHPLLVLPGILLASVDGVKFSHPGAQHRLFAEAVDLRQTANPLLDVLLENLPRVVG